MPSSPVTLETASTDDRLRALRDWLAHLKAPIGNGSDCATLHLDTLVQASSDAGFRRYFRLQSSGPTLIAMDAPPPEKSREFVDIQARFERAGVRVPKILAADIPNGFMLLEDLGTTSYLDALQADDRSDARRLMQSALESLILWQRQSAPGILPDYDAAFFQRELELFPQWYLTTHLGITPDASMRTTLDSVFAKLIDNAVTQPTVFVHRDYMPRNLMLVDGAPAVLDFQDAVMGPVSYDVASLFRDAFLSWDESFELDGIAWYWGRAKAAGLPVREDFSEFYRELEWMGLQRHLKILGLFARLRYRDDKPRYLEDAPRFIQYVRKVASRYRELVPLARLLDKIEGREAQVGYTF